jgi:release factor glutamine methyltransferase
MGPGVRRDDTEFGAASQLSRGRQLSKTGQSVDSVRRQLAARLSAAGVESAEIDARLLLGAVLKLDLTGLVTSSSHAMTAAEAALLDAFAARRAGGEPVARILGQKEFWGLPLRLSAATLVPRPDTETVIELALEIVRNSPGATLRIADIGTGSGAILLALLSELPGAFGVGTDISLDALATARRNARELGLAGRAAFVATDYAAALAPPFDLVVSNPPYIRSADIAGLAVEVRDHDPISALDGGKDGMAAYRAIIPQAASLLAPGGTIVVEGGQGQNGPIAALMAAAGLAVQDPAKADLAGIPRAIAGLKMPR